MKDSYKTVIIIGSIAAVLLIAASVIFTLMPKDRKQPETGGNKTVNSAGSADISEDSGKILSIFEGIITDIDLDSSQIVFSELGSNETHTLTYTGSTNILTVSGRHISATQLRRGDIVTVSSSDENRISCIAASDSVWKYKNVSNLIIDRDLKKMTIGSTVYRFDDSIKYLNGENFVTADTLSSLDYFDVYGIDNYIFLIKVASGHGSLSFANASDFIGGSLSYSTGKTVPFTENLKLMLAEGNYSIHVENNSYTADAEIKISRDFETVFDLFDYGAAPVEYGSVTFNITPAESELYIDGVKTLFDSPVKLSFGEHETEVSLGGYTPYFGTVNVDRTDLTRNISLSASPVTEAEEDIIYDTGSSLSEPDTGSASENKDGPGSSSPDSSSDKTEDTDNQDEIPDVGTPDSTTDDGDFDDLEVIDGDEDNTDKNNSPTAAPITGSAESATDSTLPDSTESKSTDVSADNSGNTGSLPDITAESTGIMTIYCGTDGTEVSINGVYAGTVENGMLTLSKPSGTITVTLVKEGCLTKNYTIMLDDDEAEAVYKFPDMTRTA